MNSENNNTNNNDNNNTNTNENKDMTEQHYIELANQFKEILDDKIKENEHIKNELKKYKCACYKLFGVVSVVNELMGNIEIDRLPQIFLTLQDNLEYVEDQLRNVLDLE